MQGAGDLQEKKAAGHQHFGEEDRGILRDMLLKA
jgi:hypothetical protein